MKTLSWPLLKAKEDTKSQNYWSFEGHEVSQNLQKIELERFKGAAGEDFREVK